MFRELTTPLIAVNPTTSYALGWAVYDWNGLRVVEHNGGSEGISAIVSFIPEKHLGFVFLANTSSNAMTKVGTAPRGFSTRFSSDKKIRQRSASTRAAETGQSRRTRSMSPRPTRSSRA